MHTMPTEIYQKPELGTPRNKEQSVGSQWCLLYRGVPLKAKYLW